MSGNPREVVAQAYDHIAEWYLNWTESQRTPRERYTEKLLLGSQSSPRILDLGCGSGIPVTRLLLDKGAQVTANDISSKQLEMAKSRCPEATFISGDMSSLNFEPESFDGIASFYAIFHLPRAEQKFMLGKIHSWLKPGGIFVLNLATIDEEEIHGEMMGHGMFWSSFDVNDNREMITDVGFELIEVEVLEAGDGQLDEDDPDYGTVFMWIAARKKPIDSPPSVAQPIT